MSFRLLDYKLQAIQLPAGNAANYALLTLNNPPLNALSSALFRELDAAITKLESESVRLAIVTGAGRAFVAGADIGEMRTMGQAEAEQYSQLGQRIFDRMANSAVVFIAAVNGFALGGGLELALAADIRIVAENAQLGLPEPTLGLIPGFGGTQRLQRLIGQSNALYLCLTAERVSANESLRLGIAHRVVAGDQLLAECENIAARILACGPQAIRKVKETIVRGSGLPYSEALALEASEFSQLFAGQEAREGLEAFLQKRQPRF
ncbi:MAG: enoyl-CoA hydratase-related protein [Turneriella sp.]|nr:enoyl-CoA hydratase-related protein [Turneriella sp.]